MGNRSSASTAVVAPVACMSLPAGTVVGIVLCVLQGIGTIDVGWFWATFPFWIAPACVLALGVLLVLIGIAVGLASGWRAGRRRRKSRPRD